MKRRPPVWAIVLVCLVLVVAVAGNLITGWRGRKDDETPTVTTIPSGALQLLADGADLVVQAEARDVRRIGDARDPSVVADMQVQKAFKPRPAPKDVKVFDTGFEVSWRAGDEMILFLKPADGLPQGATWKVVRRCVLERGAPACGFTPEELDRVTGS